MVGRCYNVDMCSQKSLSKEGKWPGVALPAREIHFRDWKSILRLPNHCQLWPTPRFYCKGGEEGVCSYWILTGNTEAAAPERPMQCPRGCKTRVQVLYKPRKMWNTNAAQTHDILETSAVKFFWRIMTLEKGTLVFLGRFLVSKRFDVFLFV